MKKIICIKFQAHSPVSAWQIPEDKFNDFLNITGIKIDIKKLKKDSSEGNLYYTNDSLTDCYIVKIEEK